MEGEIFTMIYQYKKNFDLKIFGENFVRNNKNKAKIFLKNKKNPVTEIIQKEKIKGNKSKEIKVKVVLKKIIMIKALCLVTVNHLKNFRFMMIF